METRPRTKKDLQTEINGLRQQLADARESLQRLQRARLNGMAKAGRNFVMTRAAAAKRQMEKRISTGPEGPNQRDLSGHLRFYQLAFATAEEGIAIQDAEGAIIEQNPAHRALLCYPDDELIGKTPGHYLEGGLEAFAQMMDGLLECGSYCAEVRCRTRDGRWIEARLLAALIHDGSRDILGYATLLYDVTEKKRIESALRESEERFTTFMNNTSVVAFMRDAKGRYTYVNRAFETLVGNPSAEIIGKTAFDIWPPEIAQALAGSDKRVLATGHPMEFYQQTALPGTEPREWLAVKFPIRDGRGNIYVGCMSIDVTERKSLEEQLRQSQKMEAVGRLAGGIAHDFNNLLTIIMGYSEILLGSPEINSDQRNKLLELHKAGERAALLTRQLLAFSRRQVMAPRVLNLNSVVENLRKMIERLIGEDIEFVTIPHTPLDMVKADPGQVEQIIMNLAVNARDAMPHGGRLTIKTANVEFDEMYSRSHLPSVPGNYVMIAVSDTGMGMDAETQKHIFEPFFTTKETGKGTGLGLATVYGIVKQSGGFIWVYSEAGVGSVFKIYLPRVPEQKESQPAPRQEPDQLKGTETILLAEDEAALRTLIRETLERYGYHVLEAANGKKAVRLSESYKERIHLLIADVVMPQMSGRQLAERVTAARPEIRVLYISGYTEDAIIQHGVIDPNTAFLQKPFTAAALARKVRLIVSQRLGTEPR